MKIKVGDKIILRLFLLLLLSIFIMSGINKIKNFNTTSDLISEKIPILGKIPKITTVLVILSIIILPLIILIKPINSLLTQVCAIFLIIFMVLVIIFFHNPISMDNQEINFMVRLSIIGGLLLVIYIAQ